MKKLFLPIIILCTFLTPQFGLAAGMAVDVYRAFTPSRFDVYLDTKYFKTSSNFGRSGEKQALPANSSLQAVNLQTAARYVLFNDTGIFGGLNFGNVESNNGITARTNSRLTNISAGLDYQIVQSSSWSLFTEVAYVYSNERIDLNQDSALASDGASEFAAQLVGIIRSQNFRNFARIGYDYRTEGLSHLLLYGFGSEYLIGDSSAGVEFAGLSSVKDDQQTNTPLIRETLTSRVNAGSKKYFSINPNSLETHLYYSYAFNPDLSFKLSLGTTIVGSNSADGNFVGLAFNWGFGGETVRNSNSGLKKQPPKIINNSVVPENQPGFRVETDDGVNQDLFKQAEPIKPKK
ncbi:MAG: hypothetical protein AABY53_09725 [Bdellovibrionota bacterium]